MTYFCIDWGNTRVKAALFNEQGAITEPYIWAEQDAAAGIAEAITLHQPGAAILCSVAHHPESIEAAIKAQTKFLKLDSKTSLPVMNAYHSPDTLGPDRLAVVVAINNAFPDKNNLVVSVGTCVTYNFIHKNRTFRGGAISPGLQMRLDAMHQLTDKLPQVSREGELLLLGYDTETCMRSGAIFGLGAEISGMLAAYGSEYPDFNAVLTGGDAPLFARHLKSRIFADPDLTLKGLYLILRHNVPYLR